MANPVNLRAVIGVIDKATAPMRGIARGFAGMGMQAKLAAANVARLSRQTGFSALLAQMGKVGQAGYAVIGRLKGIAMAAASIAGVGAMGGLAGIGGILKNFAERGDNIAKMAARLGMSVEAYQEYGHAAKEADIDQEQFDKGLGKLTLGIADVASGKNKELTALFRHMGVSARDANGRLKSTADLLPDIADAFKNTKDPTLRMAMAVALFGEKNTQMIDLLAQGSGALAKSREEARKYGLVLTAQQIADAQALDDGYKHVTMSLQGLSDAIGGKLAPVVAPLLQSFADWVALNRKIISDGLGEAVTGIANALKGFDWKEFGRSLLSIGRTVDGVVTFFGGWKVAAIAVGVALNAGLLVDLLSLGKALSVLSVRLAQVGFNLAALAFGAAAGAVVNFVTAIRAGYGAMAALNLVMSANPIGLVIIGIAALIAIGVALWKNWDTIKAAWGELVKWVTPGLEIMKAKFQPLIAMARVLIDVLKFVAKWSPAGIAVRLGAAGANALANLPGAGGAANVGASSKLRPGGTATAGLMPRGALLAANRNANASTKVQPQKSEITATLDFKNVPAGVSTKVESRGPVKPAVNVGRAMQPAT